MRSPSRGWRTWTAWLVACASVAALARLGASAATQQPVAPPSVAAPAPQPRDVVAATDTRQDAAARDKLVFRAPHDRFAELRFANRLIIVFRATIVPREPAERAESAHLTLERLADANVTGPVAARPLLGGSVVTVGPEDLFAILPEDLDPASDSRLSTLTDQVVARVHQALVEASEARQPGLLAWAAARSLAVTVVVSLVLVVLVRANRRVARRLVARAEARLAHLRVVGNADLLRASHVLEIAHGAVRLAFAAVSVLVIYAWLAFTLRQFPFTRPWGETLRQFLVSTVEMLGWNALQALPGLFTVVVIFVLARFVVRLNDHLFDAIEQGRIEVNGLTGPVAAPTRRLVKAALWLCALVVAYPYLPGSNTDAFKGVSVLVGLVISLGSSGLVNQVMSGFVVTYSGALRTGEYVRVGDVEGTVTRLGVLSTTLRTPRNEDITIPNALVIAGTTVNFSRRNEGDGVYVTTSVTIGYDTPWRQVEAMLLSAADRTPGLRRERRPFVGETGLGGMAVEYTLAVCLEEPSNRVRTMAALRAQILDAFNEQGVQIMTPAYEGDPAEPKIVPRHRWFEGTATPPAPRGPAGV